MESPTYDSEKMFNQIKQLPWSERLQLIKNVLEDLTQYEIQLNKTEKPLRSLYGLWQGFSVSSEDITQARQEMWGKFVD